MADGTSPHRPSTHETAQTRKAKSHDRDRNRSDTKRSKAGGILGGLSFLKSSPSKDAAPKSRMADEAGEQHEGEDIEETTSIVAVLRQSQGRKRTGSLRQAAMAKVRERSGSLRKEHTAVKPSTITTTMSATSPDAEAGPRQMSYEYKLSRSTFAADTDSVEAIERPTPQLLAEPKSTPLESYASTTDEDDTASLYVQSVSSSTSSLQATAKIPAMSLSRRRSKRSERRVTPMIDEPPQDLDLDDEWDYSETEWWGWVVLIITWLVFVIGMGSCLGVWSWAWDVGETPYAPPELEDDATLPITGYYPALIVCTAVMSWVWVVIAWVGMKYFRHAKVVGEDG